MGSLVHCPDRKALRSFLDDNQVCLLFTSLVAQWYPGNVPADVCREARSIAPRLPIAVVSPMTILKVLGQMVLSDTWVLLEDGSIARQERDNELGAPADLTGSFLNIGIMTARQALGLPSMQQRRWGRLQGLLLDAEKRIEARAPDKPPPSSPGFAGASEEDPFEVLGLTRPATTAQINKAARKRLKQFHPDLFARHPGMQPLATLMSQRVNRARALALQSAVG